MLARAGLSARALSSKKQQLVEKGVRVADPRQSSAVPAGSASVGLPAGYTARPQAAVQRAAAVEAMVVPRDQEEPVLGKMRSWLTTSLAAAVLGVLALMFVAGSGNDPATELALMTAVVQDMRRRRVESKQALLAAATASGRIPRSCGRSLRWWAAGPVEAPTLILLCADEGENAAQWGAVFAALAEDAAAGSGAAAVRIVVFDNGGDEAAPRPSPLVLHRSVPLAMDDMDAVIEVAWGGRRGASWLDWLRGIRPPPSGVVLVGSGAASWGCLGWGSTHVPALAGLLLVGPVVVNRGRQSAWADAVPAASRVVHDPTLLPRLLAAPPLTDGDLSADAQARMEALNPRATQISRYYSSFGMSAYNSVLAARNEEAVRRERSKRSVLRDLDLALLHSTATGVTQPVRALAPGADLAPAWIASHGVTPFLYGSLLAANFVGLLMSPTHEALSASRASAAELVQAELSSGALFEAAKPSDKAKRQAKAGGGPNAPLVDNSGTAEKMEHAQLLHAWYTLPYALGLASPPIAEQSFAYLGLQRELRELPPNFSTTLVHRTANAAGPTASGGGHFAGVVSLPLQCPDAVAAEVRAVLAESRAGQSGRVEVRRFGHVASVACG